MSEPNPVPLTQIESAIQSIQMRDSMLNAIGEGVVVTDALSPDCPIVYVNPAFERMTGYRAADVIGRNCRFLQGAGTDLETVMRLREAIREGREFKGTLQNYRRDGTLFLNRLHITPVHDASGRLTSFVGVQADVTDQVRAFEALAESERKHRAIAEELTRATQWLEAALHAGRMMAWEWDYVTGEAKRSNTSLEVLGIPSGSIGDYYAGLHPDDVDKVNRAMERAAKQGTTFHVEYRFTKPSGELVCLRESGRVECDAEGRAVRAHGVACDITAQIRLEEQLRQAQKMETVGQLTGGIAHDFNNLLTVILGNAEVLTEELAHPQLKDLAAQVLTAAERGAELNQKLLAFGRRQSLKPRPVRLDEVTEGVVPLLKRTLGEHIELVTRGSTMEATALVDRTQLESAILNLAVNARDAMPDGGTLTIEVEGVESPNGETEYVSLTVQDSGIGMPENVLEHAFEPFFTTKEVGKGSGLGLAMVHGFVEQSGGYVTIRSSLGAGTSVTIVLPAAKGHAAVDEAPAPRSYSERGRGGVLVVEDEPDVRRYATATLLGLGYYVTEAPDAETALKVLNNDPAIELLFTDVVLPKGINGLELARRAQVLRPQLKVLLTSGYPEEAYRRFGRPSEATALLPKPYKRAQLARAIQRALKSETTTSHVA
jgi:PAS domain S-box-containing protein